MADKNTGNISEQTRLLQTLADVASKLGDKMDAVEETLKGQLALTEKLASVFENMTSKTVEGMKSVGEAVTGLSGKVEEFGSGSRRAMQSVTKEGQKLEKFMGGKFTKTAYVATAAFSGLYQGFRNFGALSKSVFDFFGGIVSWVTKVSASILSIPLKIFSTFVEMAAGLEGGTEFAQAIEDIRKQFGDLHKYGSKAVMQTSRELKGFSDTGLSAFWVFGNLAEAMNKVREVATAMGSTFSVVYEQFKQNGGAILGYQKGLGIADEDMKGIAERSIVMGETMGKTLNDITKQSLRLGDAFGIDQKLIARAMSKAIVDVKHFGQMTIKEIGQAEVYARKLGIELEKIVGVLDAFETFDTAAENAAKLTQSFGVQVDALKMMEAQNPAEMVDQLRKSFKHAGVASENMNRQQLKLLATQTGLNEETVKAAFSSKNHGVSLDDIKKKSEAAEKAQLTQAQAMKKLADSIERMVKQIGQLEGSFVKMFIKGMKDGIFMTGEFIQTMLNIRRSLIVVYGEGRRLGAAMVKLFPGLNEVMTAIRDFFQPAKFRELAHGVTDIFIKFMKDLKSGQWSFDDLMKNLQNDFFGFFNKSFPQGKKMLEGFKTMMKTISQIIAAAAKWIGNKVAEGIKNIVDLIVNPEKVMGAASGAAGAAGFAVSLFAPIIDALKYAAQQIWPELKNLFGILFDKAVKFLTSDEVVSKFKHALIYIAPLILGPAVARTVAASIVVFLGKSLSSALFGSESKTLMEKISHFADKFRAKVPDKGAVSKGAGVIGAAGDVGEAATSANKKTKITAREIVMLGAKIFVIAVALAGSGLILAAALGEMKTRLEQSGIKTLDDAKVPMLILAEMCVGGAVLAGAAALLNRAGKPSEIVKGMVLLAIALTAATALGAGLTWLMTKITDIETLKKGSEMMWTMSKIFLMMIPVVLGSALLGAAITGSAGIGALAAAAGIAALSAAVIAISATTMTIMAELDKMEFSAGFDKKVEVFVKALESVRYLMDSMSRIMEAMAPSLFEILKGETFGERINKSKEILQEMIGDTGGGGIKGIIAMVMDCIREFAGDVSRKMLDGAKIFSALMSTMAPLLTALRPPDAMFAAGDSIYAALGMSDDFNALVDKTISYMQAMQSSFLTLLNDQDGLLGIIDTISTLQLPSGEQMNAVSAAFNAIANIMQTIMPSEGLAKAFAETSEASGILNVFTIKESKIDADKMNAVIRTLTDTMLKVLPTLTDSVFGKIIEHVSKFDPKNLEALKSFSAIMSSISEMVSTLVSTATGGKKAPTGSGMAAVAAQAMSISQTVPMLKGVFDVLKDKLPDFINSMTKMVSGMKFDDSFVKKLDVVKKLFEFLSLVPQLATSLVEAATTTGGNAGEVNVDVITTNIDLVGNFLSELAGGTALQSIFTGVDALAPMFKKVEKTLPDVTTGMKTLATSMKDISDASIVMGESIANMTKATVMKSTEESFDVVKSMLKKVEELDNLLAAGTKVDIVARLKSLGASMGIGTSQVYKIASREVVVNIALKVEMNVDEVEKVMIMRKNSIIRDTVNYALENSSKPPNGHGYPNGNIPETRSPWVVNTLSGGGQGEK